MGQKWIAMLAVTFEMKDDQPPNRAENVLRGVGAQLRLNIMTGQIDGRVKPGSAEVEILRQGALDAPDDG